MMNFAYDIRDGLNRLTPIVIPTLARVVFLSVLFFFFWNSALTKFEGPFTLSSGAYVQIFPAAMEAVGYNPDKLGFIYKLVAYAGSYAEIILPIFIGIGFLTRLSALGMIAFIAVLSYVDVVAYMAETGAFFDGDPKGLIFDQRVKWSFVLMVLVFMGAGPISVDRLVFRKSEA